MPFFFGGDGATLLIPDNLLEVCLKALNAHKDNVRDNFGLELRVGSVPLHELTDAGFSIRIAKLCLNSHLTIPVVLGMGLYEAERRIKADDLEMVGLKDAKELDLTGMNCRWDKIEPPRDPGEILTLLVESKDGSNQGAALASVIRVIEDIYGPLAQRIPISADKMQLKADAKAIGAETILQFGKLKWPYYVVNRFLTFIGKFFYGKTPSSREYMKSLVLLSDTLSIDGRINTVISGTEEQRKRLLVGLLELEEKGKIVFGAHISAQSIMSCYVRNHEDEHLHFVDGSEGGYTQAAKILKGKLRT